MSKKLYAFQEKAIAKVRQSMKRNRRVIVVSPTGSGKSVMATSMVGDIVKTARRRKDVLITVHRKEIVDQFIEHLGVGFRILANKLAPGCPYDPRRNVHVASTQTLLRSKVPPPAEFMFVDECHHYTEEWSSIIDRYDVPTIGWTATPVRADGVPMANVFDDMVVAANYKQLIGMGRILKCQVLRPEEPLGIDMAMDPVDAYMMHAFRSKAFIFCRDVKEAKSVARRLRAQDIAAKAVTHDMGETKRKAAIGDMKSGRLTVLTTVFALTEGVDIKSVQTIISNRAIGHFSTMVQMAGRALRPDGKKESSLFIDLTGSTHKEEMGLPTDNRKYSLEDKIEYEYVDADGDPVSERGRQKRGSVLNVGLVSACDDIPAFHAGFSEVPTVDYKAEAKKIPPPKKRPQMFL